MFRGAEVGLDLINISSNSLAQCIGWRFVRRRRGPEPGLSPRLDERTLVSDAHDDYIERIVS